MLCASQFLLQFFVCFVAVVGEKQGNRGELSPEALEWCLGMERLGYEISFHHPLHGSMSMSPSPIPSPYLMLASVLIWVPVRVRPF